MPHAAPHRMPQAKSSLPRTACTAAGYCTQMLEWDGLVWAVSVGAVALSGAVAAAEGHWWRGARLDIGFITHGGMWGDAALLALVNGLVAPWLEPGWWFAGPALAGVVATIALHAWWHGGRGEGLREHMWPARRTGRWWQDLSWSGWCHVLYVAGEVALLAAYLATPMPPAVVLCVSALLTLHVPLGVLQPPWIARRRVYRADLWQTAIAIAAIWAAAAIKIASRWP